MGPLAAQQKPKLWQLNYFTDKAELEALGPRRPGKEEEGAKRKDGEEKQRGRAQKIERGGLKNQWITKEKI